MNSICNSLRLTASALLLYFSAARCPAITLPVISGIPQAITVLQASPAVPIVSAPGGMFNVTYHWKVTQAPSGSLKVLVHFVSQSGALVFSDDFIPTPTTDTWSPSVNAGTADEGKYSLTRTILVPASVPPGTYQIFVGLYDPGLAGYPDPLYAGPAVTSDNGFRYSVATLAVGIPYPTGRKMISIDDSWFFQKTDVPGGQSPTLIEDSAWSTISLPHTYNAIDGENHPLPVQLPNGTMHDCANDFPQTCYYAGPTWYRKHYVFPREMFGQQVFISFGAADQAADVYVNGTLKGTHLGGFTNFNYDITSNIKWGVDNVIAVRVDNSKQNYITPLNCDFAYFGGIYRDVALVVTSPVHIATREFYNPGNSQPGAYVATPGVFLYPAQLPGSAGWKVDIKADLQNSSSSTSAPMAFTVHTELRDAVNALVRFADYSPSPLAGGITVWKSLVATFTLTTPQLWSGVKNPYLYHVVTRLIASNGVVLDEVTQPLGFRTFAVDKTKGFSLNGTPMRLNGIGFHQDWLDKGWALTTVERHQNLALLKELGANAVRLAHYPHDQETYQQMDENGFVTWAEVPVIAEVSFNATWVPAYGANSQINLIEMIRQNFNHPSIMFWALSNEVLTAKVACKYQVPSCATPDPLPLIQTLNTVAKYEDPSRKTVQATVGPANATTDPKSFDYSVDPLNQASDLMGYNIYAGWYDGFHSNLPVGQLADHVQQDMDFYHSANPGVPFATSEHGAGASPDQHQDPPTAFHPDPKTDPHFQEWQSFVHEGHLVAYADLRYQYQWAHFVWCLADFAAPLRHEGDVWGRNDKGLLTFDRQIKKDAFYLYKAAWNSPAQVPVVHINSKDLGSSTTNPRNIITTSVSSGTGLPSHPVNNINPTGVITVKIYSNLAYVDLYLDGQLVPAPYRQFATTDGNFAFLWSINLGAPGWHVVSALGSDGVTSDSVTWYRQ